MILRLLVGICALLAPGLVLAQQVPHPMNGPASSTVDNLATYGDPTGSSAKDSGLPAARVVVGPATSVSGNAASYNNTTGNGTADSGVQASGGFLKLGPAMSGSNWLETYIPPSASLGQISSIATAVNPAVGAIGVVGAARTSDFSTAGINAYGLAGFAINDHATQADVGWAELLIAVRKTAAVGATLGVEINATNAVNNIVDVSPFTMFPATGITAGVWIAPSPCSFPAGSGICASPTYNDSTAIGIVGNGAVLKTVTTHGTTTLDGIASTAAIVVNGPVNGECIPTGTTVSSKAANSVIISNAATCSTTETVNFSSVHRKGIVFDGWSLDPATGPTGTVGVAVEMAMKQAVRWVNGTNVPLVTMFSDAVGGLQLNAAGMSMQNGADATEQFTMNSGSTAGQFTTVRFSDRGLPWWDVGKQTTNVFVIRNAQTGKVDFQLDTADTLTLPNLGAIGAGTGKHFLCIDTVTKIIYDGTGASCN